MNNNVDINEALRLKNQELLLKKRVMDLENAMDSLILFYNEYSINNIADEVNNRVCMLLKNDNIGSNEQVIYSAITKYLHLACEETKKLIMSNINNFKAKLTDINNDEYSVELNQISVTIIKQMNDYYLNNLEQLLRDMELTNNVDIKEKIKKYLTNVLIVKLINILESNLSTYIQVIANNYKENNKVIDTINEKTIKRV